MAGSYVGLVAAAASEVTTRLPGNSASFSPGTVVVTSTLIIGVGVWLIVRNLSQVVARAEHRAPLIGRSSASNMKPASE
jgi:ABC-type nickel/cobalt efflux system permease component RcnA